MDRFGCDHQFHCIKGIENMYSSIDVEVAAVLACVLCGQIRRVDCKGNILIEVEKGTITKWNNGNPSDPNSTAVN